MNNPIATINLKGKGQMKFELFLDTPISTANFISLAESGFYNGLNFHRVIPGFVAQGGCPQGTGTGGPGYTIDGEFANNGFENPHLHEQGVLSWARSMARNSAGSQFFITLAPTPFLDGEYAVFGKIIEGEEFLTMFEQIGSNSGHPSENVIIESIKIDRNNCEIPELVKVER